ncbi:MAG: class I SAM-dependent methyltransferase [Chloroflexia bacterium]
MRQKTIDFFNQRAGSYNRLSQWSSSERMLSLTASMIENIRGKVVVDIGAGTGVVLNLSLLDNFQQKIAVDIAINMLLQNSNSAVQKVVADAHCLPLKTNLADLVICRQVLHYCEPSLVLREVARIINSSGFLHIVQLTGFDEIPDWWYKYWAELRNVAGRTYIKRTQLLAYADQLGFTLVDEQDCELPIDDFSWKDFFEKNQVSDERKEEVMRFFQETPTQIAKYLKLRADDIGISYGGRFSFLLFSANT